VSTAASAATRQEVPGPKCFEAEGAVVARFKFRLAGFSAYFALEAPSSQRASTSANVALAAQS